MKKVVSWEIKEEVFGRVVEGADLIRSVVRPEGSPTVAVALPTCAGGLAIAVVVTGGSGERWCCGVRTNKCNRRMPIKIEMQEVHKRKQMPHVQGRRGRVYARIDGSFIVAEELVQPPWETRHTT